MKDKIPINLEYKIKIDTGNLIRDTMAIICNRLDRDVSDLEKHKRLQKLIKEVIVPQGNKAIYNALITYLIDEYKLEHGDSEAIDCVNEYKAM